MTHAHRNDADKSSGRKPGRSWHAFWFAPRPSGFPGRWMWVIYAVLVLFCIAELHRIGFS